MGVIEGCKSVMTCSSSTANINEFLEEESEVNDKGDLVIFNSKIERIMFKLKFLKNKAMQANDMESLKHVNWIISTIHDKDLHEPINRPKETMDKEALDILGTYSQNRQLNQQINDTKQVMRYQQLKQIRKSEGYQKFINKFKKKIGNIMNEMTKTTPTQSLSDIPKNLVDKVKAELNKIDTFEFNIFELDKLIQKRTLYYVLNQILNGYGFIQDLLHEKKYQNFIYDITYGYNRKVPYHNDLHGTDVLQTVHLLISKGNLINKFKLTDVDVLATLIAAACHDFKHNGYNNAFHMNVLTEIAINYNDVSVLENMHISETYKLISKDDNNLFEKLSPEQKRTVRRRIIECILATDMATHQKKLNEMKSKCESLEISRGKNLDKLMTPDSVKDYLSKNNEVQQMVLSQCVHTADLSNPAKLNTLFVKWTDLVYQEFFAQGDKELELKMNISMLCDRKTVNIYKSQVGFIKFVVLPQFDMMLNIVPEMEPYLENINNNLRFSENNVESEVKASPISNRSNKK